MMNKMLMVGTGISSIGQVPILGGGRIKSLSQLIKSIFSKGEAGFAYDMSDMSTLFQDASGTIPVTAAGQPVGLILDKSKGLAYSAELFTKFDSTLSSTLSSTTTPTVVTSTVASGIYGAVIDVNFMPEVYKISFAWEGNTTGREMFLSMPDGNNISLGFGVTGTYDKFIRFKSQGGLAIMRSPNGMGQTFTISSVSVKRLLGNHAYQTFSASRPILRQTPILGNELIVNGDFSGGLTNVAPRNTVTTEIVAGALKVTNAGTSYGYAEMVLPTEVGKTYLFRGDVVESSGTGAAFHIASVTNSNDIANNVEGSTVAKGVTFTAKTTTTYLSLKTPSNATGSWRIFDNMSIKELTGYSTDQNYLEFDGVDDFLVTNSIDFTMTDKVSLFAGVRKLSDVNTGIVAELSTRAGTSLGAFVLYAPFDSINKGYGFRSVGTLESTTRGALPLSPTSNVLAAKSSIAQDTLTLRVDSLHYGVLTQDQGTGNYGNYPLYIGRRGGTSLPFNGHLYSLIGISRLTTNSETIAIEKAIAKATGVTLNV